ncbi:hypothetical protein D7X48_12120 [bacterium D16-50]|nr:hypothetical protein D7X48_12120 [bacterium D16-50]
MRLGGIGGESGHTSDMHRVTECMHDHAHFRKDGSMAGGAGPKGAEQTSQTAGLQEGQLSLSAWMEKVLGKGKSLLKGLWGGNEIATAGEAGDKSGEAQVLAQIREDGQAEGIGAGAAGQNGYLPESPRSNVSQIPHAPQVAAAATAVAPPQVMQENPYFSAVENIGGRQETLWRKMKVRFKDITGQLAGHLPKKFSGFLQTRNSFQARQQKPKQDLRKHSKYREDKVEIDCVLTDDSYLLDSYDRKGEYSKLSTKK